MLILSLTAAGGQKKPTFPGTNVWQLLRNPLERLANTAFNLVFSNEIRPEQTPSGFKTLFTLRFTIW